MGLADVRVRGEGGHLDVLMGARERLPGRETCRSAAKGGHLEVLMGARERLPVGRGDVRSATRRPPRGAAWGRENGCPWDAERRSAARCTRTCSRPQGGDLEVVKLARENGCPWDGDVRVMRRGRPPRGPEVGQRERMRVGRDDVRVRGAGGHLEVLKWAHQNGCEGRADGARRRGWPPRGAAVGARERLPVGRGGRARTARAATSTC